MHWLVICVVFAIVLSPLMWFKQSPRQARIAELRRAAFEKNIMVSLHRRPDARDNEKALDCVCYKIPVKDLEASSNWVLHRYSQRGWESKWTQWKWVSGEADLNWDGLLSKIISRLPAGATAIMKDSEGFGVIWDESAGDSELTEILNGLRMLKQHNEK